MTSLTRPGHRDTGTQAVFGQVHPSWQQGGELAACPTMTKMSPCPWQEFSSKQAEDKQQSSYKIVFVQTIIFTVPSFKLEQNYQSSCFNPFLPRSSQVYHPGKQSWNIGWSSPPLPGGSPQASPHSHTPHLKVQKVLSTPCQLPPGTCSWSVAGEVPYTAKFLFPPLSCATWQFLWAVGIPQDSFTKVFAVSLVKEVARVGSSLSSFVVSTVQIRGKQPDQK